MCGDILRFPAARIAVRSVGLRDRRVHLLPLSSILYFFAGGAARGIVTIPGYAPELFRRGRTYARTRDAVYGTFLPSLGALSRRLDPRLFRRAHRGIVVNLRRIDVLDPACGSRRVGFRSSAAPIEWVPVGQSFAGLLGVTLGMPRRRARGRRSLAQEVLPGIGAAPR